MLVRTRPITNADPFRSITRDFDRFFDAVVPAIVRREWTEDRPPVFAPPASLTEQDDALTLEMDLPGVPLDAIEVLANADTITVRGVRTQENIEENATLHLRERFAGSFERTLSLPAEIDPDAVEARLVHGVLRLTLPKTDTARRPRRVQILADNGEHTPDQAA